MDSYQQKILSKSLELDPSLAGFDKVAWIGILEWGPELVGQVLKLLLAGKHEEVKLLAAPSSELSKGLTEDLIVLNVTDIESHSRWILAYDSDELWQDPFPFAIY